MKYNLDKLNELAEGDKDFILDVIKTFLEEIPNDVAALEFAINGHDYDMIYNLAHKIKPNVDILGIKKATDAALDLSFLGKKLGEIEEIKNKFSLLRKDIQTVTQELKTKFDL